MAQHCEDCPSPMSCAVDGGCQRGSGPSLDFELAESLATELNKLKARLALAEELAESVGKYINPPRGMGFGGMDQVTRKEDVTEKLRAFRESGK